MTEKLNDFNATLKKLSDPESYDRQGIISDIVQRLLTAGDQEAAAAIQFLNVRSELFEGALAVND